MTTNHLPIIHPGEILRLEFLEPLEITPYRLSKDIGVPQTRISEILAEKRSITADTALRLARYFSNSPQFWLNLQTQHDLRHAMILAIDQNISRITNPTPKQKTHRSLSPTSINAAQSLGFGYCFIVISIAFLSAWALLGLVLRL
jgi:antitoxin HigA-1